MRVSSSDRLQHQEGHICCGSTPPAEHARQVLTTDHDIVVEIGCTRPAKAHAAIAA